MSVTRKTAQSSERSFRVTAQQLAFVDTRGDYQVFQVVRGKTEINVEADTKAAALIIGSDQTSTVHMARHLRWTTVSNTALIKLLAFIDHGRDETVLPATNTPSIVALPVSLSEYTDESVKEWFAGALARKNSGIDKLCHHFRLTEGYRIVRFLIGSDPALSIDELSLLYGLSSSHFRRKCKMALGKSLKAELRLLRAARSMLDFPDRRCSFTHLAEDHGFCSPAHFSFDIKALFGFRPSDVYNRNIGGN
jgi:AraC-like DNA-binding protein